MHVGQERAHFRSVIRIKHNPQPTSRYVLCVSICVRRKARLRIAEQIQVYENAQTACGLRAFGLYGNSTARPVQTGDAPSFYGVVGALLRGSHRCVSLGALFRTHTCRVKEGIKAPFTTPSGQTLREDYSRQTGHLHSHLER